MSIHQHPPSSVPSLAIAPVLPIWPLLPMELNPESILLSVKAGIIGAHTFFSMYPIRIELSPQDVQKLARETGDGTTVYLNGKSYEVHVLATLAPNYIKFVFPLEEGPSRG